MLTENIYFSISNSNCSLNQSITNQMDFAKNNVTVKVTWHEIASLYIIAHQIQSNMNYDWRLEVLIIGKLSGRVNTLTIAA